MKVVILADIRDTGMDFRISVRRYPDGELLGENVTTGLYRTDDDVESLTILGEAIRNSLMEIAEDQISWPTGDETVNPRLETGRLERSKLGLPRFPVYRKDGDDLRLLGYMIEHKGVYGPSADLADNLPHIQWPRHYLTEYAARVAVLRMKAEESAG